MLIKRHILNRIADGDVDRAFRWWKRPTVKKGGRLRTAIGELSVVDVGSVSFDSLTAEDARRAGYRSLEDLRRDLPPRPDCAFYKITLTFAGEDKRLALREDADLSAETFASLMSELERIDKRVGAKALSMRTLELIGRYPKRRAQELADELGLEKLFFKAHVRKLKEKGLTESLSVGYRLSPRGQRVLEYAREEGRI
ncbi:hypothetical protein [Thalassococcus sp. S3]|uniref:hypothetical protein n=1 Tax=Thalassococcus sp. S3 TaxID=2017482 RepID=UPI0010241AE0|nr:hypothetical protein [Thalassococcus sp. S3]QBF31695.1 hypothetical protein CFI11_10755 [Thalassococcus sp. S3]